MYLIYGIYSSTLPSMFWKSSKAAPLITAEELALAINEGGDQVLVDVRSSKEFAAGHLPGALNIPLEEVEVRAKELDPDAPTVFY